MTTTNNEPRSQNQLRAGLIVDAERLAVVGPAVRACPLFELCGQSGMPQTTALPDVPWHGDDRVLIGQPDLQVLLLATSTRSDAGLAAQALERGLPVWRLPPLARTFGEAAEIAASIKRRPVVYRIASWWEQVAEHVWRELEWPADFKPLFSEIRVSA